MKKRRRLFDKVKNLALILLLTFSTFFYVPMSANASGVSGTTTTKTITYNKAESEFWHGNSYQSDELNYYDYLSFESDTVHSDSYDNHYWYLGKRVTLFNSTADYYGYKITFTLKTNTRTNYDEDYCHRAYWLVGTPSDLYNGNYASGNVGSTSFTAWVTTDNSVQAIHLAPYFNFTAWHWVTDGDFDTHSNYYDIYNTFTVSYTGYKTASEYLSALSSIESKLDEQSDKLDDIDDGIDNLTNGFESSQGDKVNSDFESTLTDYGDTEGSLFDSATTGLNDFTFFDLNSVPALLTGMSLISSLMTSWFVKAGGVSGVGIVVSVLFTVMLISMALGLYRFYQSASHRNNGKGKGG